MFTSINSLLSTLGKL